MEKRPLIPVFPKGLFWDFSFIVFPEMSGKKTDKR